MNRLLDRNFKYHDSASHATSDGLKARMRRYAKQMQPQDAERKVTPITSTRRKS